MLDHDPTHSDDACCGTAADTDTGARLTRRHLLGAVAVGVGVYGVGRLPTGATGNQIATLTQPGQALEAADRLPHPIPTTTVPDTTVPDSTLPTPLPVPPPGEGELMFPILVGEEDSCLVLDNFGDCRSGCSRLHEGVDIMADEGLPIVSVATGVITNIYTDRGLTYGAGNGWTIYDEENDVTYKYFHMRDHAEGLEMGSVVEAGQIIGTVGETGTSGNGNSSSNFHCHFEYRPNNIARDSFDILHRAPNVRFFGE